MVGWHHRLKGREFVQTPEYGEGQGCLVCCSPWGHEESDMTEQLKWLNQQQRRGKLRIKTQKFDFPSLKTILGDVGVL